jgi:hypothetical protein
MQAGLLVRMRQDLTGVHAMIEQLLHDVRFGLFACPVKPSFSCAMVAAESHRSPRGYAQVALTRIARTCCEFSAGTTAEVYRPFQTAMRFSTKASIPSAASSSAMLQAMVSLVKSYASAIERSICR